MPKKRSKGCPRPGRYGAVGNAVPCRAAPSACSAGKRGLGAFVLRCCMIVRCAVQYNSCNLHVLVHLKLRALSHAARCCNLGKRRFEV
jgi:hypothetical protein